jgi:arsenate reductase
VLFLCTGNSARSVMAECLLNQLGCGRFEAASAGSHPQGAVHPLALELLSQQSLPTAQLRSKKWDEFAGESAPPIDIVITVCDNAAGETCPIWPGHPVTAHWGIPDPAAAAGSLPERQRAFRVAFASLRGRIESLVRLPLDGLDSGELKHRLRDIGKAAEAVET